MSDLFRRNHRLPCVVPATNGLAELEPALPRREFLQSTGRSAAALAAGVGLVGSWPARVVSAGVSPAAAPESVVKVLFESLTPAQRESICFDWDYQDPSRGLLRTRVENNWHVTKPTINSDFFSNDQRRMIRDIFEGIIQPEWHARIDQQLQDDAGGFGNHQNIAIFGTPGDASFQFVMTGRHMTLRCDGNSAEHVAFGGPIFYGHAGQGFNEKPDHPGNVFWPQAIAANQVFGMLDGRQRAMALVPKRPRESDVELRGTDGPFAGIPISELSADQQELVQKTLQVLLEPYRQSDRDEVAACLQSQGGLAACRMAFYQEADLGDDQVWDNWRLEGPAFVWHFRGAPHVHVWVHVADNPTVKLNAHG